MFMFQIKQYDNYEHCIGRHVQLTVYNMENVKADLTTIPLKKYVI